MKKLLVLLITILSSFSDSVIAEDRCVEEPIYAAARQCPLVCSQNNEQWNGQWTNQAASPCSWVCGCK